MFTGGDTQVHTQGGGDGRGNKQATTTAWIVAKDTTFFGERTEKPRWGEDGGVGVPPPDGLVGGGKTQNSAVSQRR